MESRLSRREKRVLKVWGSLILITCAVALTGAILLQSIYAAMICVGIIAIDLYWFYVRYHLRRKPRYPLVPPEGKGDIYLPRTNIPRPVYEDFREMKERKRKLAKIRRMMRRKKQ